VIKAHQVQGRDAQILKIERVMEVEADRALDEYRTIGANKKVSWSTLHFIFAIDVQVGWVLDNLGSMRGRDGTQSRLATKTA